MLEAALWGLVAASALIIGAEIAFRYRLSSLVIGLIMAFGVGTLISSIAFELVEPSLALADGWLVLLGLVTGALTFYLGDRAIARMGGGQASGGTDREPQQGEEDEGSQAGDEGKEGGSSGMGIALGAGLDGIPESAALGISLAAGGGVSIPLLAAIWISNFPESLSSSVDMVRSGRSPGWVRRLWWSIAMVSALSAAVGYWVITVSDTPTGAFVQTFAAGALLTMIADEMAPQAFGRASLYTGLATTAGFILAVGLGMIE
jgi:ZIP family zinc transporter